MSNDEMQANIDRANDVIMALKRRCDRAENESLMLQVELASTKRELDKIKQSGAAPKPDEAANVRPN